MAHNRCERFGETNKMDLLAFHDGNISDFIDKRSLHLRHDTGHGLQMHSSLIRRLSQERELEGHSGCVNAIAWNSKGTLLISGSDDTQVNIYSYSSWKLLHSIETGHSANIFCTKFVPETSDELVISGAGDCEVRLFNLSRLKGRGADVHDISPSAVFQCHTRRVKKLAVEVGNPYVVWSASEDGTLRQHDFREVSSCPPAGSTHQECRNVLLDLRSGGKKSLADPPKQLLTLKSCDISSTRPHLLLVGGSDSFARLYDRRMLPPLSSCRKKLSPPRCVNYFCPIHLSDRGHSSLHLTHVGFSPNGEEVLLSYSGEHVYLMDVKDADGSSTQYSSADAAEMMSFTPIPSRLELPVPTSAVHRNGYPLKNDVSATFDKCRKLVQIAEKSLWRNANYHYGIEVCNEVLDGRSNEIEAALMYECLCVRAGLLLKRKWKNDSYMAVKDCNKARRINSSSHKALHLQAEALFQLGKHKEALDFANAARLVAPLDLEVADTFNNIKEHIAAAEAEKFNRTSDGTPNTEPRAGRVISLSDILHRSEGNSDTSQDGPRSDPDVSDYEEELEVEIETPISDNEHDAETNVHPRNLNLRFRRGDPFSETGQGNDTCGSPTSSSQSDTTSYQPVAAIDMKQRFVGHCNVGTDIKQASFLGQRGEYIASGSDDGKWFIWEKRTGRLIKMLVGDEAVVNCVQCHPTDCVVATSGIDNTIKIWTPTASVPYAVASGAAGPETNNVLESMENNQRRLSHNREMILPYELLERFRMHEFAEGSMHPFECAQS